ncbi:hypothetical protein BGZ95_000932 [Linnemannia exigua]|uniref:Uncharacterized protein n=1 Tax=Linnemannia exigua TaxID=604196 RepID=A0AAD4H338_9FUNG|nr:hypothetical protein BGZ95_000932 [Linnemannia exigua]
MVVQPAGPSKSNPNSKVHLLRMASAELCDPVGKTISQPYLEELPKESVNHLSEPDVGDVVVLKKMQDFVQTNNIFTSDIAELLSYLASDQCAHGYGGLVAGCEGHCANHELSNHVISKWDIPEEGTFSTAGTCSGIDYCVYLKISEDGSSPDRLHFEGNCDSLQYDRIFFSNLGSPLCLYRLGCTFPSAVHIEPSGKSAWWSALTHKATGKFFGFSDIKGRVALRIRSKEVFLNLYMPKNGDLKSVWLAMRGLKEQQSMDSVREPYLDTLPQELVDNLSAPETGNPALLEELSKFVEDNRVFKEDMLALLNYLASDQCVHGYDDLVAGYEA